MRVVQEPGVEGLPLRAVTTGQARQPGPKHRTPRKQKPYVRWVIQRIRKGVGYPESIKEHEVGLLGRVRDLSKSLENLFRHIEVVEHLLPWTSNHRQ